MSSSPPSSSTASSAETLSSISSLTVLGLLEQVDYIYIWIGEIISYRLSTHTYAQSLKLLKQEPKFYGDKPKKIKNKEPESCEKNLTGIFDLNFDCLVQIISYLELKDMANLDLVSDKFKPITGNSYKKYKSFDFKSIRPVRSNIYNLVYNTPAEYDPINFSEAETVLKQIGSYITSIFVDCNDCTRHLPDANGFEWKKPHHFLELISMFCPNLENILIEYFDLNEEMLNKMRALFPKLKSIELICCIFDDSIGEYLETAKYLEKIKLNGYGSNKISGKCISNIKNLISLNLYRCTSIQPNYFTDICINNKNLIELNIQRCDRLTPKFVVDISTNLLNLEELSISASYCLLTSNDFLEFANLSKLKKLYINGYARAYQSEDDVCDLLVELAKKDKLQVLELTEVPCTNKLIETVGRFKKLEIFGYLHYYNGSVDFRSELLSCLTMNENIKELRFDGGCGDVTEAGLISFVEKSRNLRVLTLTMYGPITNNFYHTVSTSLKKQNRKHCLTVTARGSGKRLSAKSIDPEIIEENMPWIQLNY